MNIEFTSRLQLPTILNELGLLGLGVEVGVQRGVNALHIRSQWKGQKLFLVDPWQPYYGTTVNAQEHEWYYRDCVNHMLSQYQEGWEILRMPSLDGAAEMHKRGLVLDFAYLDGAHEYPAVVQDIGLWWPLIKSGGILAGHDYVPDGWHRNGDAINGYPTAEEAGVDRGHCGPFEVVKAVQDFFGPNGREPLDLYITSADTDDGWRSWMVIKP
jgi:hypothetical protein